MPSSIPRGAATTNPGSRLWRGTTRNGSCAGRGDADPGGNTNHGRGVLGGRAGVGTPGRCASTPKARPLSATADISELRVRGGKNHLRPRAGALAFRLVSIAVVSGPG